MIQLIEAADRPAFESQLAQMYRERKRVFVDRLGWEVPVVAGEFEIDQFDTDRAVYVLALDPGGAQLGSARLLPSTGPTLLSEVFPHLCERGVPTGDDIWEITRMCTAPGIADAKLVRQKLMVGMVEFALLNGVRRFTLVSHIPYLSALLAIGWDCEPLGDIFMAEMQQRSPLAGSESRRPHRAERAMRGQQRGRGGPDARHWPIRPAERGRGDPADGRLSSGVRNDEEALLPEGVADPGRVSHERLRRNSSRSAQCKARASKSSRRSVPRIRRSSAAISAGTGPSRASDTALGRSDCLRPDSAASGPG